MRERWGAWLHDMPATARTTQPIAIGNGERLCACRLPSSMTEKVCSGIGGPQTLARKCKLVAATARKMPVASGHQPECLVSVASDGDVRAI